MGSGADVALAAARALDEPGEQVVGVVRAPKRGVLAAFAKDLAGAIEEVLADQRLVRRWVVATAEEDLADVRPVRRMVSTA